MHIHDLIKPNNCLLIYLLQRVKTALKFNERDNAVGSVTQIFNLLEITHGQRCNLFYLILRSLLVTFLRNLRRLVRLCVPHTLIQTVRSCTG